MLKVFYYYYYLLYTRIIPDDQPHATVIFTLSFSLSLLVNGIIDITLAHSTHMTLNEYQMLGGYAIIAGLNYLFLYRDGRGMEIVRTQPKFFNNHKLSIKLTFLFWLVTTSILFWKSGYIRDNIKLNC